jgi:hypothetical protein
MTKVECLKMDIVNQFREGIGSNQLQWGAAYYPFLNTTI